MYWERPIAVSKAGDTVWFDSKTFSMATDAGTQGDGSATFVSQDRKAWLVVSRDGIIGGGNTGDGYTRCGTELEGVTYAPPKVYEMSCKGSLVRFNVDRSIYPAKTIVATDTITFGSGTPDKAWDTHGMAEIDIDGTRYYLRAGELVVVLVPGAGIECTPQT